MTGTPACVADVVAQLVATPTLGMAASAQFVIKQETQLILGRDAHVPYATVLEIHITISTLYVSADDAALSAMRSMQNANALVAGPLTTIGRRSASLKEFLMI